MPIYEYECRDCHHMFERRQRFDEEPISVCPECAGKSRRVIHSVPVMFKGSGFYCTDNGRGSSSNDRCKDSDIESATPSESKADTDSPPKPKAETTADA